LINLFYNNFYNKFINYNTKIFYNYYLNNKSKIVSIESEIKTSKQSLYAFVNVNANIFSIFNKNSKKKNKKNILKKIQLLKVNLNKLKKQNIIWPTLDNNNNNNNDDNNNNDNIYWLDYSTNYEFNNILNLNIDESNNDYLLNLLN